ncbi:1-(5-phosphoribosyl)-5-[(5-phosphoribosylamino)methylideneamino]imidazole-4-carboxamide isomerase [Paracrocinitomix mangrovi]|uniref:1-(5-phosphoribosyl)-5-[(5- phosphoribosylamino)methylideneamino]imidazole-4- carboxamide isomerase n=1 Tax=Paracrocinitomix mangrovi TaxID=2862509 RepID=UPI001C8E1CC5|nr:1-(5-phosphoribosyl)-5-[(5-phosphoribosylamino)methylideneamino]imidazole-4-carboxamide isomerase [Paracrocinitomix mangrovi]UKN02295.1 1-(5-phosphoribosyl)-5-[(5-phosphoribosylamino)methylideneamino]imidazole-4-carboxamide isomerase [Paracrocinitomix mangrovi]
MRIIPAIDIIEGQCVRLTQGDYNKKKIYSSSPLDVAKSFEDVGMKYLHLVDLDGAKSKKIVNDKVLEAICSNTNLIVDFGGGIRSINDLEIAFESGAKQVTVGSLSFYEPEVVYEWIAEFGADKIIIGADVKDKMIAVNGWQSVADRKIDEFIEAYSAHNAKYFVATDVAVDGTLTGPSVDLYRILLDKFPEINLVASGGVSCLKDIEVLKSIGIEGVIVGKAIYENKITLKELSVYVD